jgi:hypothetical protein
LRVLVGAFETVIDHQKRWKCKKFHFVSCEKMRGCIGPWCGFSHLDEYINMCN